MEEAGAALYLALEARRHWEEAKSLGCRPPLAEPRDQLIGWLSEALSLP